MRFILFGIALIADVVLAAPLKIDYQIRQNDPALKKLVGDHGSSMVCWPSALAHRMVYFQRYAEPSFPKLKLSSNPVANVEKFALLCRTSTNGGTSQRRKVPCIQKAFQEAGYKVDAFSIGEDAEKQKRSVRTEDLIGNLESGAGVILHIAWWRQDPKTKKWVERGSHSVNAYSAVPLRTVRDKGKAESEMLKLAVVDPGVDYSSRSKGEMFDEIVVKDMTPVKDDRLPSRSSLEIQWPAHYQDGRRATIKNIYVFKPTRS